MGHPQPPPATGVPPGLGAMGGVMGQPQDLRGGRGAQGQPPQGWDMLWVSVRLSIHPQNTSFIPISTAPAGTEPPQQDRAPSRRVGASWLPQTPPHCPQSDVSSPPHPTGTEPGSVQCPLFGLRSGGGTHTHWAVVSSHRLGGGSGGCALRGGKEGEVSQIGGGGKWGQSPTPPPQPPSPIRTAGLKRGGGVRSLRASRERFRTTLLWMAQLTQ